MAPAYKEENYVIIHPGSANTLVRFGLEDPVGLPSHSIPTLVYKTANGYSMNKNENAILIRPIVKGKIIDINGFLFLIKSIINSFMKLDLNGGIELDQLHVLIVQTSKNWGYLNIEKLINYLFESLSLQHVSIVPLGLSAMFSYGSFANSVVIDVGLEKTEIWGLIDYEVCDVAGLVINKGGESVTDSLIKLLPGWSRDQIEDLKKSDIFQCLSAEDAENSFFGVDGLKEKSDDEIDVAEILTEGKETDLIEGKIQGKPNAELEVNSFVDRNGQNLSVAKERFQGCGDLINSIVDGIYHSLKKIIDPRRRQDCYEHVIFCGQTTRIPGFKELVMVKLADKYLVSTHKQLNTQQKAASNFRNNIVEHEEANIQQVPRHMKLINKPDYFSTWKKHGFEDCSFLGAQIMSKQIFNHNNELSITKSFYLEEGPSAIWKVKL